MFFGSTRWGALWVLLVGCGSAAAPIGPTAEVATPASVSVEAPGGDAPNPHAAALRRLIDGPMRMEADRDGQVLVALPDGDHWKRVRFFGTSHFVGFRYGSDHHAVAGGFRQMGKAGKISAERCLTRFEERARDKGSLFSLKVDTISVEQVKWRGKLLPVHRATGSYRWPFSRKSFHAAWVAYPAYEDGCLVLGFGAHDEGVPDLAYEAVTRWIEDAVPRFVPKTKTVPDRAE